MRDGESLVGLLPTPSIVVDEDGGVLRTNEAAERLFGPCLRVGARCTEPGCDFNAAIDTVRRAANKIHSHGRVVLKVKGTIPLEMIAISQSGPERRTFLLLLFRDDCPLVVGETVLTSLYDLTSAEARLVAALVNHDATPMAMARAFSVSINTIRTHLKRIYSKIGVNGQSGLVRKILSGPALYLSHQGNGVTETKISEQSREARDCRSRGIIS